MDPDPAEGFEGTPRRRRRLSAIVLAALAAVLIACAWVQLRGGKLLTQVKLRGERGSVSRDDEALKLAPGERVRLEIGLGRPAAILVLLQDLKGALSEIHPQFQDAPVFPGPTVLLPSGEVNAWSTADLEPGHYALWVLASPEPIPEDQRARLRARLEDLVQSFPQGGDHPDLAAAVKEALGPPIRQFSLRWFVVHPN